LTQRDGTARYIDGADRRLPTKVVLTEV